MDLSGGRFDFRVKIGNDVFAGRDRRLHGCDPHQFLKADRPDVALKRDNHVAAQLLELDERQTVIGQHSHPGSTGHGAR